MRRNDSRGFSLLLILFVLVVMSVVGVTAASMGGVESTTARAHSQRAQALLAAEMGIGILTASGNAATIESLVDSMDEQVTALPSIDFDGDGTPDHRPVFVVRKATDGVFVVEGQLRDEEDRILSRARLSGRAITSESGDGYTGQIRGSPRGTGVIDERDVDAKEAAIPL